VVRAWRAIDGEWSLAPAQHEQDDEGGTNEAALTKQQAERPRGQKSSASAGPTTRDTFNTTSFKLIALVR